MGGADVSLGTIASAMGGLAVLDVNQRIDKYVRENKFDAAVTLRTQYGFGDKVQKGQLWDILSGDALLAEGGVDKADAAAQTKREGDKRVVHITGYHDGMSKEEQFALGITLAHEAYRNGVDDGTLGQRLETNRAVLGHIGFANRMAQTYGIAAIGEQMAYEVLSYYKAQSGQLDELAEVLSDYDSSADYWRLISRKDGTHRLEWDGSKDLTTVFEDRDAHGNWQEVGRTKLIIGDNSTTRGQALYQILGASEAMKQATALANRNGDFEKIAGFMNLPEAQRQEKIGEYLMESQGMKYVTKADGTGGSWTGSSTFSLTNNSLPSYLMVNKDAKGNLERFTVTATLDRNWKSWESTLGVGVSPTESNNKALDTLTYVKRDLNNRVVDTITMSSVQSVDVYDIKDKNGINRHQPYYSQALGHEIEGNTVVSDFSLQYNKGDTVNYTTIHNAWTIDGSWINRDGLDDDPAGGRWLNHGGARFQTSDGCFIVPYEKTQYYYERLKQLNIPQHGQIAGKLIDNRVFWIQLMGQYGGSK